MRKFKPSKAKAREFAKTMDEIRDFCVENKIDYSLHMDSYYFSVNGKAYRVSNHAVESSPYHPFGRLDGVKYIHAGKTRIMEIYQNLVEGKELDGHGNIII